jgi:hypothetical protein
VTEAEYIYGLHEHSYEIINTPTAKTSISFNFDNDRDTHSNNLADDLKDMKGIGLEEKVKLILQDTIYPSKSPMPQDDPFKYLTSFKFLGIISFVTITLMLFRIIP